MRRIAVLLLVVVSVLGTGKADADVVTRTAPFDVGCVGEPPCSMQWERARAGDIEEAWIPFVSVIYGPPFVWPSTMSVSTNAGVWVRLTRTATIRTTVTARDDTPVRPMTAGLGPVVCLNLLSPSGGGYRGFGCQRVLAGGRAVTASTDFDNDRLRPGRYLIYANLMGGPARATVESFSYRVTAA